MEENNLEMDNKYALALVNIKGLGVKTFSYLIPDEMKARIKIGQAILVPFGRQGLINAFCVGFSNYLPEHIKAKKINKIIDQTPLFTLDYLKLLEWVANYYICDFVSVLNMAIPMKLLDRSSKTEKLIEFVRYEGATKRQTEILKELENKGKIALIDFEKGVKTTRASINKLETIGCVKITEDEIYRNPLEIFNNEQIEPLYELSGEQEKAYKQIKNKINKHYKPLTQPSPSRGEGKNFATKLYSATTLNTAIELRKRSTDAENILWYLLRNRQFANLKFRRQSPIDKYVVDFVCFEKKLIIEADDSGHLNHKNIKHDKKRDAFFKSLGYKIIRINNDEIFNNIESVINKVYDTAFDNAPSPLEGEGGQSPDEGTKKNIQEPILIHGVTASGKTEVYFKLIDDTIKQGKNVLFLAPEIALASQLTKRLAKKFGTKDVAIWHSSISEGERYDVWQKLYKNEIKILAGARSAVFAPLCDIGLIIIDEEHESAYKQTSPAPRYDAKTVAQKLAEFHNCPLILGSATPDVKVYYRAFNTGNLIEMKTRFNNAPVAKTSVINMQNHSKQAYRSLISIPLQKGIEETLEKGQQVILLINRRGFSTYTQCQACGYVIECEKCAIPMIWHTQDLTLKCHYCNRTSSFPDECPKCGSDAMRNSGTGTQKIEILIKELYKDARIERIDSDILSKKNAHIELLDRFQEGEIDILIGTQMIAKGLDNPNVTLVGVISADASFNLPDFRASERGFQLLTQVAGRSGRGKFSGSVIFQTYNPDFYALESAKAQDYNEFYETEIESREEFDYPPFSQVIRLVLASENNFRAEKSAQEIAMRLIKIIDKQSLSERLIILGPSPCVIEKIKGMHRFQIIIKNKLEEKGHTFLSKFLQQVTMPKDIKLTIDVDPIDIL